MGKRKRRFSVTLIEMIIVMILIATITGALAYNYRETLNEGRAFRTRQGIERLEAILTLHMYDHPGDSESVARNWQEIVQSSPLGGTGRDTQDLLHDGWGQPYQVSMSNEQGDNVVHVSSKALENYETKRGKKRSS